MTTDEALNLSRLFSDVLKVLNGISLRAIHSVLDSSVDIMLSMIPLKRLSAVFSDVIAQVCSIS